MASLREKIFRLIQEQYGAEPEYLWAKFPNYAVFRHSDNQKWFGIVMNIAAEKLDPHKTGTVDILNIKIGDLMMRDFLMQQDGFYAGYHISRGSWLSIVLDGTVPLETIAPLIGTSWQATASGRKKQEMRPPKEWLIPSNPKFYDIVHAFDSVDTIDWKQGAGIRKHDTVFLYVGAPVSAVLYQCSVLETDIPYDFRTDGLTIKKLMKIKLMRRYSPDQFTFERLKNEFGIFAVRSPRGVPNSLLAALEK